MRILEKTRMLTVTQAYRLLSALDERATEAYALRVLRQLRYMQKLRFESESLVTLPSIIQHSGDISILAAIDIMLDISKDAPLDVGGESPPFSLRFLTDDGNRVGSYGVVVVEQGNETMINFQVEEVTGNRTIIYLIENKEQRTLIKTTQHHYFAVKDGKKYRYYADKN